MTGLCWNIVLKQAMLVQFYFMVRKYEILHHLYHAIRTHHYWVSRLCKSPNIPNRIQRVLKIYTQEKAPIYSPHSYSSFEKTHCTEFMYARWSVKRGLSILFASDFYMETKIFISYLSSVTDIKRVIFVSNFLLLYTSDNSVSLLNGLGVACWPLVPKYAGSNPTEAVGFFRAKKSSACLPSDGK